MARRVCAPSSRHDVQEGFVIESALEARGVTKVYRRGTPPALTGINLAIPRGSITALVGPNGAGKSTLMKAWVGFERPTQGEVAVHGLDPFRSRRSVLKRVAYIAQATALYREFTGEPAPIEPLVRLSVSAQPWLAVVA